MINEYTFYRMSEEYEFKPKQDETFKINNHKVSKEVYKILFHKVYHNRKLATSQDIWWQNHISKSCINTCIVTFIKEMNDNE